jgi:phage terminase large subunit-like protein
VTRRAVAFGAYPYTLAGFRSFARHLKVAGRPMVIEPHEETILEEFFAGATEVVALLPKKNGKTTLLAALALFHLLCVEDAAVYIGASSKDQAARMFDAGDGLVTRSGLEDVFDVKRGYRLIRLRANPRAMIRVLASDAKTGDGVDPTLALVDELHRHPNGDLYGVFRDGLVGDAQMVTISTAGARMASPLGELRKRAHSMPSFRRDEARKFNHAASEDGSLVFLEWCLSDADDTDDIDVVKLVNPASWQTVDKLRRRHDSPSMEPWTWLRFACGIWTEGEEPWIEPPTWDRLAEVIELAPGEQVWADVRVMFKRAAIVIGAPRENTLAVVAQIIDPAPYPVVEQAIRDLAERYDVQQITHGARGFARSAELLEEDGLPMVEFPATPDRMSEASGTLYRLIESKSLHHDGSPEFRAQVLAGHARKDERGWRLTESETHAPIEALVALAVVAHTVGVGIAREPMIAWV